MQTQYNDPKGQAGSKKAPLGLVPPRAMEQTAWVHKLGADKYGPWNWRETGVCATTYVNAILRHLNAWRDGEDLDPESGITHLAHIACSANILMDAEYCGKLQDDRNKRPISGETEEGSLAVGELLTISEFADILKWIRGEDEELEVADCDLKEEPEIEIPICGHESIVQVTTEGIVYRILDDDEIIQAGDEYFVTRDRSWHKTSISGDWGVRPVDVDNLFRRKITKCDLEEAADCDLKEESPIDDECKCGRRKIYHWLYGYICEDCDLKSHDSYYP